MSIGKRKSRSPLTRRLIIAATALMGLMCLIGLVRAIRTIVYMSKDLPYENRYQLKGDSYLNSWSFFETEYVDVSHTKSVRQTAYSKSLSGTRYLHAYVTFVYYDTLEFANQLYEEKAAQYTSDAYGSSVQHEPLSSQRSDMICGPDQTGQPCKFVGLYGTCVIEVVSDILDPSVSRDDYKQLIEDYIDPQMAAWSVCYGRELS